MTTVAARSDDATLAQRLGVPVPVGLADELSQHLRETAAERIEALAMAGLVPAGAVDSPYAATALPASVAEVLALAISEARLAGAHAHADLLAMHYLESVPTARLEQLLTDRAPHRWLFHAPVPWEALPRFRGGLERLFALLARHGLDAARALGAASAEAWLAQRATLADFYVGTYYGRLQPMFQALPHDLARIAHEVVAQGGSPWTVVDRRLGHAMLHEVLHFAPGRNAIFPPYFDEALAGYFGVVLDAGVAYPEAGDDSALAGWPWFSQVGQALVRAFGEGPILAAHAGLARWDAAVPSELLARLERRAWEAYRGARAVHFHPDMTRPDVWVRMLYAEHPPPPDPERDLEILLHALSSACLVVDPIDGGGQRVHRRRPTAPLALDFAAGVLRAPDMLHALPPLARTDRLEIILDDTTPAALTALARRILQS